VPTHAVAAELTEHLFLENRIHVIGEGVSETLRVPSAADERAAALQLPPVYVVTLATLEPRKDLEVVLRALATRGAPDLPLLVVGQPGWGGVDMSARSRALGLVDGQVRELGWLSDPDVAVVLSRAAALLMPSRAEGFGLPVLEAMHLGVPVIASDAPALFEVACGAALHHAVGDAAALAEAMRAIVNDEMLAASLRDGGLQRVAAYDWMTSARQTWQLYESLR
jgi:glycosyltransferase involved in cell wall biosynthesis